MCFLPHDCWKVGVFLITTLNTSVYCFPALPHTGNNHENVFNKHISRSDFVNCVFVVPTHCLLSQSTCYYRSDVYTFVVFLTSVFRTWQDSEMRSYRDRILRSTLGTLVISNLLCRISKKQPKDKFNRHTRWGVQVLTAFCLVCLKQKS